MKVLLALAGLLALACAAVPDHWEFYGVPRDTDVIPITVALKQRNLGILEEKFWDISDPQSQNWRRFMTKKELKNLISPSEDTINRAVRNLKRSGAVELKVSSFGDFITAKFKVEDLQSLLGVKLQLYKHVKPPHFIIARSTSMYQIPSEWAEFVDIIGMISEFPEDHLPVRTSNTRKNRIHTPKAQSSETPGPQWGYPQTSDTRIYAQVTPVCSNGKTTSNPVNLCADNPPAISSFVGSIKGNDTGNYYCDQYDITIEDMDCSVSEGVVSCKFPVNGATNNGNCGPLEPYQMYNVAIQTVYTNGDKSAQSWFPAPLATTPFVTPQQFWRLYDFPLGMPQYSPSSNNSHAIASFSGQFYSPSDLKYFWGNMSLPLNTPVTLVGPDNSTEPGDEATLDIQWISATGVGISTVFWSVKEGYLLEWAQQVLDSPAPHPLVFSISYGGNEHNSPLSYRQRVDVEFQKMGVLGISVCVSSGDAGATNVGHGSNSCTPLQPQYPASSPYITSVSATFISANSNPICYNSVYDAQVRCPRDQLGEIAVAADYGMDWTTGGGFSSYAARPSYQSSAVLNYMKQNPNALPPNSMFNSSNRAYPDVSANGNNGLIILGGAPDIGSGTSLSSPSFAGIISFINDQLIKKGKQPLGFLNPLLYQMAQTAGTFYDVTVGDNYCGDCLHPPYIVCCPYGYQTTYGWDAVTGLGNPRVQPILQYLGLE